MVRGKIIVLTLLFFPVFADAAPFLVSDPYGPDSLQPTGFVLNINGREERTIPRTHPDGSSYLCYDLKDLPDGDYLIRVKAVNSVHKIESVETEYRFRRMENSFSPVAKPRERMGPSRSYKGYIGR